MKVSAAILWRGDQGLVTTILSVVTNEPLLHLLAHRAIKTSWKSTGNFQCEQLLVSSGSEPVRFP